MKTPPRPQRSILHISSPAEGPVRALGQLRPGGRIAVVDMGMPTGGWRALWPMAWLACFTGGADPYRMLWNRLLTATKYTTHQIIRVAPSTSPLAPPRCPYGQPVSRWNLAPPDEQAWDLLVIGGGTAGIVGAKTAAGLGASVLLVKRADRRRLPVDRLCPEQGAARGGARRCGRARRGPVRDPRPSGSRWTSPRS